jgi:hypothetical protein
MRSSFAWRDGAPRRQRDSAHTFIRGVAHVRDPFLQVGRAGLEALPLRKHHVEADRGAAYYEPEAILERLKY